MAVIIFLAGVCVGILTAAVAIVAAVSLEDENRKNEVTKHGNTDN